MKENKEIKTNTTLKKNIMRIILIAILFLIGLILSSSCVSQKKCPTYDSSQYQRKRTVEYNTYIMNKYDGCRPNKKKKKRPPLKKKRKK